MVTLEELQKRKKAAHSTTQAFKEDMQERKTKLMLKEGGKFLFATSHLEDEICGLAVFSSAGRRTELSRK